MKMFDRLSLLIEEALLASDAADLAQRKANAPAARSGGLLDRLRRLIRL